MAGGLKKTILILLSVTVVFVGGFLIGQSSTSRTYGNFLASMRVVRSIDTDHPFVRPIVGLDTPNALSIQQFGPLFEKVEKVFLSEKEIDRHSVYFRDFQKGLWIGINENDKYFPASMLKVALAIAVYKQSEDDLSFLTSKRVYTPELGRLISEIPFSSPTSLKVGNSYEVKDLVKKMIVDSDNGAKDILLHETNEKVVQDVYTELGLDLPDDAVRYSISTRKYALFFRVLYGGSYLNRKNSNELLSLLSEVTFKSALVAGVPDTVPVSHKFGEAVTKEGKNTVVELHDCGVVYHPERPYLLCVMTQGKDTDVLQKTISLVSKIVYEEVNAGYK